MRKLAILTVALLAALSAGVLAVTAGSGSSHREAPLSSLDPTADDTDVYAFTAPDAPGSLTLVGQLDPLRGSGRRPELLPVRRPRPLLPQRRQHRRRQVRHPLPVQVQDQDPQPELVPLRAARRQLVQRPQAQPRADLLRSRVRAGTTVGSSAPSSWAAACPWRRTTSAPRRSPTTTRSPTRRSSRCRAAARSSPARSTIRSSSTSARPSTPSTSTCRAARAPATRAAARTTSRATTSTRSCCRCRRPTSPATTRRRLMPRPPTRSSACGPRRTVRACRSPPGPWRPRARRPRATVRSSDPRGPGQPPRQPAGQRGGHPAGQEGPVQRDPAVRRPQELRQVRALAGARQGHQHPLFPGLNVPETNRTDIVQALLTGIPGLTQIARARPRPTR